MYMSRNFEKIKEKFFQFNHPLYRKHLILESDLLKNINLPKGGYWFEFGVFQGSTINKLSLLCNKIYGFDSFEGLPEDWLPDHPKGTFRVSELPIVPNNVELVVGLFEESIPKFLNEHSVDFISFINIDCDLYSSTKTIFKHLGPLIKKNTYIYFDEFYTGLTSQEEIHAFSEFIDEYDHKFKFIASAPDEPFGALVKII